MAIRYKLLIADQNDERREHLKQLFSRRGYCCIDCPNETETVSLCCSHCPDLIVLDADVSPSVPALVQRLRDFTAVPILVHFSLDDPAERIAALDAGADDCLLRPYDEEELLARLRRALRRAQSLGLDPVAAQTGVFRTGELLVDYRVCRVYMKGRDIGLTQREYRMVALLCRYAGQVLSYDFLAHQLWGERQPEGNQILRVNLTNIRRKMGDDSRSPRYIVTHPGLGYRLALMEEPGDGRRSGTVSPNEK